jgi:hypothetical protein
LTETRELRNISRTIPRVTQFRVLKRENQVCAVCNAPVRVEEIEFDHFIPWSKGGSSDDSNIRLLCRRCNRKRRAQFEKEFIVESVRDHLVEPMGVEVIELLIQVALFGKHFQSTRGLVPKDVDYAREFSKGKIGEMDRMAASTFGLLNEFFANRRPLDLPARIFGALKMRWGAPDSRINTIKYVASRSGVPALDIIRGERDLLRRLGFVVKSNPATEKKWLRL